MDHPKRLRDLSLKIASAMICGSLGVLVSMYFAENGTNHLVYVVPLLAFGGGFRYGPKAIWITSGVVISLVAGTGDFFGDENHDL